MLINRLELLHCLQSVIRVVASKPTLPIMAGIALSAGHGTLDLRGSDLETGIEVSVLCEGDIKTVLPGKMLLDIITKVSGEMVEMILDKDTVHIKSGKSNYKIAAMEWEDYPVFPEIKGENAFTIPAVDLQNAIKQTAFSVSDDQTRPSFTGLCLNLDKKTLSATNGHRLAQVRGLKAEGTGTYIIPSKTAKELLKINGGIFSVVVGDGQIEFVVNSPQYLRLFSRLIEGEFPDVESIMNEGYDTIFAVNVETFLESLKRVAIINAQSVELDLVAKTMTAEGVDDGAAKEEVELWYEQVGGVDVSGTTKRIAFSPRMLADGLGVMGGKQAITSIKDATHPMMVTEKWNENYVYILAPTQVREKEKEVEEVNNGDNNGDN